MLGKASRLLVVLLVAFLMVNMIVANENDDACEPVKEEGGVVTHPESDEVDDYSEDKTEHEQDYGGNGSGDGAGAVNVTGAPFDTEAGSGSGAGEGEVTGFRFDAGANVGGNAPGGVPFGGRR